VPLPTTAPAPTTPDSAAGNIALELVAHGSVQYRPADETYQLTRALPPTTPAPQHSDFDQLLVAGLVAFDDPWALTNLSLHLTTAGRVARDHGRFQLMAAA